MRQASQADNGQRRTTQVLQLDTAEQTAEQLQQQLTKFEQPASGERRTTQALQLDTAEQTAEQLQAVII
jgi:hypothetical protein